MSIVDVEIILKENETVTENLSSSLANELGRIFNSPSNSTWVKVHELPVYQYAENIHIIYEPDGNGRVTFGGKLIT